MKHLITIFILATILAGCTQAAPAPASPTDTPVPAPTDTPEPPATDAPETDSTEAYTVDIDPADFVEVIDNPYFSNIPGSKYIYEGETEDGLERIEVEVLDETREVMGVTTTVVRDTVYLEGEVIEDTFDWFAQDNEGNVWYFGEDSKEYEDGEVVSDEGSWEAGIDGALPGIVMPGDPQVGQSYRQEYYAGEAEDMAEVINLSESESVSYGSYDNLLVTKEWNPLEPGVVEQKYYASGVGLILEVKVEGGSERVELIEVEN